MDHATIPIAADFLSSAADLAGCPNDDVLEVAFVGRSNAGKSSTLNQITGKRSLARVSKTPGRTRLINLFATDTGGRIVDLPGYGYAKASRAEQQGWQRAVDDYLESRANLRGLVLVMDARHPLKALDGQMVVWANSRSLALLVLLNKADKLKQAARSQAYRAVLAELSGVEQAELLLFSATTGEGVASVRAWLRSVLVVQ